MPSPTSGGHAAAVPYPRSGQARARGGRPGWLAELGGKRGDDPLREGNSFFILFLNNIPQISFLSKKNSFLGLGAKIEVVPKFFFYNFAKRSKVKT
jgi:hypothetical protein